MTHKITATFGQFEEAGIHIILHCNAFRTEYDTVMKDIKEVVTELDSIFTKIHLTNEISINLTFFKSKPDD